MKVRITGHRELFGIAMVVLGVIVAVRYLFAPGFLPTHDGEYHLIRFYEFGRMLAAGHLFPRWAPGLNSGYGVPLFTFFYPLPNYVGALFHFLGWSLADSLRLTMAVGYGTAVVASYFWLKRLFGVLPAVVGSVIGAFTPYWFVDIFVRGSVGEVVALGFVFVALATIAYEKKTLLTLSIAAIILSHNIMAVIFLPILFLYVWMTDRSLLRFMIVGIILTSYFWVPALFERQYVVGLNTVNFRDHFPELAQILIPSWGAGFSGPGFALDEMSYQIGLVPLFIFLISPVMLLRKQKFVSLFMGAVGVSFFLMLEVSIPLWEKIPLLQNLQYPWRLLSVVIVATPFLLGALLSKFRHPVFWLVLVGVAVMLSFSYTKPVLYESRSDAYYLSRREFTDGTSSLGNGFSTRWMAFQPDRRQERMEIVNGEGFVAMRREGATTFIGDARLTTDAMVRINVAYYPGWRATIDGKNIPVKPDSRGMITVPVSKGDHVIGVYFSETPLRIVVDLVSLGCLVGLVVWGILRIGKSKVYKVGKSKKSFV